mgnify:FL=1
MFFHLTYMILDKCLYYKIISLVYQYTIRVFQKKNKNNRSPAKYNYFSKISLIALANSLGQEVDL